MRFAEAIEENSDIIPPNATANVDGEADCKQDRGKSHSLKMVKQ
jgi:hypothetical protein